MTHTDLNQGKCCTLFFLLGVTAEGDTIATLRAQCVKFLRDLLVCNGEAAIMQHHVPIVALKVDLQGFMTLP